MNRKRDKTRRITQLPNLLTEPRTVAELATYFGCQHQEIQRDLRDLRSHGLDIQKSQGRPPLYHCLPQEKTAQTAPVRAVITHAMLRLLHHHAPTPSRIYHQALTELADQLPERLRSVSSLALTAPSGDTPRVLETIAAAWCWGQPVRFLYKKPNTPAPTWNTLHILFMEISRSNHDWYIIGRRPNDSSTRTFLLSRMLDAERLTDQTSPEQFYDPRQDLDGAWGIIGGVERCRIELRFHPDVHDWIADRQWPGQRASHRDEAGYYHLILEAPLHRNGVPVEILTWIRGWAHNVDVVSPPWLRARWLAEAQTLLERSRSGP
ncbi:helix-turn-helix transcriptional regulator [Deinococcus aquiradiocola]|uniref:DNA-binding transcriptional regulator n=1 Tax=Deinococcus aquiradiocola TaxID=393059 RepID=A0A917PHH5_9DEIO|nr:WYL domain-containing protein [Deinococcus aquiradiocola]GGJ78423.1 DNA-binding transcriptional regulator [Deinococcus aquiradiocola]